MHCLALCGRSHLPAASRRRRSPASVGPGVWEIAFRSRPRPGPLPKGAGLRAGASARSSPSERAGARRGWPGLSGAAPSQRRDPRASPTCPAAAPPSRAPHPPGASEGPPAPVLPGPARAGPRLPAAMACGATLKRTLDFDPLLSPASPKRRRCAPLSAPASATASPAAATAAAAASAAAASPQKYLRMEPSPFGDVSSRLTTGGPWLRGRWGGLRPGAWGADTKKRGLNQGGGGVGRLGGYGPCWPALWSSSL